MERRPVTIRPAKERYADKLALCLRNAREARRASWQESPRHRQEYLKLSREAMLDARVWRGLIQAEV